MYTAIITATGKHSHFPEDPRAVDADVYLDGVLVGGASFPRDVIECAPGAHEMPPESLYADPLYEHLYGADVDDDTSCERRQYVFEAICNADWLIDWEEVGA